MQNETTERGYERDYVDLPPVEEGDEVRVRYVSGQNGNEQERTGEVVEVHANGFTFVHESGDEGQATSVRDHEDRLTDRPTRRRIGTVQKEAEGYHAGNYVHAAELNRNHEDPDETEVEVLDDDPELVTDGGRVEALSTVISERFALDLGQVELPYSWHNTGKGTQAAKSDISDGERLDPPEWTVWLTSGMVLAYEDSGARFEVDFLRYFPGIPKAEVQIIPERDEGLAPDSLTVSHLADALRSGGIVPGYVLDDDYEDLFDRLDKGTTLILDFLDEEGDVRGAETEVTGVEFYPGAGKSGDEWIVYADDHSREEGFQVHVREFGEDYVTGYGRLRSMKTPEDIRREMEQERDRDDLRTDGGVDDEDEEWNPQPASLREGETRDISSHARRNLETINTAEEEGVLDEDEADDARERILSDEEGV